MKDLLALMKQFREAYARADREGLLATTTNDFEWCQHLARDADELPRGRTLKGVDALLEETPLASCNRRYY